MSDKYFHTVQPLSLPDAAGEDQAAGDVRHFSREDAIGAPALSRPTRQLAHRDTMIGSKLNEVIHVINNKEQYIVLPTIRSKLIPGEVAVVCNHWIPAGFEARVLSLAVSPVNDAKVEIQYNPETYGAVSGSAIVASTISKTSAGTEFFGEGEFIVRISNASQTTIDASASVVITMRPVGAISGAVIGTEVRGTQGPRGEAGPAGPAGFSSIPGPKGDGFRWRGNWSDSAGDYVINDVVRHPSGGSNPEIGYVWVAKTSTNEAPPTTGTGNDKWDLFVAGGVQTVQGDQGDPGPPGLIYAGDWTANGVAYSAGSVVIHAAESDDGSRVIRKTYWAVKDVPAYYPEANEPEQAIPVTDTEYWAELFGSSSGPVYSLSNPDGLSEYATSAGGSVEVFGSLGVFEHPPVENGTDFRVAYQELTVSGGSYQSEILGYAELTWECNALLKHDTRLRIRLPAQDQAENPSVLNWRGSAHDPNDENSGEYADIMVNFVPTTVSTPVNGNPAGTFSCTDIGVAADFIEGTHVGWTVTPKLNNASGVGKFSIRVYGKQSINALV